MLLEGMTLRRCDFGRNLRRYLRIIFLLSLLSVVFMYHTAFLYVNHMNSMDMYKDHHEEVSDPRQLCQMPVYHPFEKEVLYYFRSPRPISCRSSTPVLTFIDRDGYLRYNDTAFAEAGYSIHDLKCFYQEIHRIKGSDENIRYGDEIPMTGMDRPRTDFLYVACKRYSWLPNVYSMYHAFAQRNSTVRKFRDDVEVGVAVVGLDSVSRLNFMRQLPQSYNFITNDLNGIVLRGFNKVGENTFPNLIAMLTGNEPLSEWPKSTFDNWPFIWNALKDDKVATFYGEDCSAIMTFAWWGEGFDSDPTTHYFRPFWLAVDSSSLAAWSSPMCLGAVPKHKIYLDYLKSFLRSYQGGPMFMFSLENEPSHDYLNTVGVVDDDLRKFLSSSFEENLFNRTILFVLSDHGQRMDEFRKTKQGKVEDRMPMVSVVLPDWFSRLNPHILNALKTNSKRLTSSFDLYSTFVDIFRRNSTEKDSAKLDDKSFPYKFQKPKHGMSLFETVPLNRTCEEAGIPEMYCVCMEGSRKLGKDEKMAEASAQVLTHYINDEVLEGSSRTWRETVRNHFTSKEDSKNLEGLDLNSIKKCSKLTVEIEEATLVVKPDGRRLVHLTFKTYPNQGLFEGRVVWPRGIELKDGKVHEDIIRINRYGKQSNCLQRAVMILLPLIRSVCYCT